VGQRYHRGLRHRIVMAGDPRFLTHFHPPRLGDFGDALGDPGLIPMGDLGDLGCPVGGRSPNAHTGYTCHENQVLLPVLGRHFFTHPPSFTHPGNLGDLGPTQGNHPAQEKPTQADRPDFCGADGIGAIYARPLPKIFCFCRRAPPRRPATRRWRHWQKRQSQPTEPGMAVA
jgi:hypothetical protein